MEKIDILRKKFEPGVLYAPGVLLVPVDDLGLFAIIRSCIEMDIDFTKLSNRGSIPYENDEYELNSGAVMVNDNMHQFVIDYIRVNEKKIIKEFNKYKEIFKATETGDKFIKNAIGKVK